MSSAPDYLSVHESRLDFIFKKIDQLNLSPKSVVLDVGVYPPILFNHLKSKYVTYGISSPQEPVKDPNIIELDLDSQQINKPDNSFDLIVFTEIIEHLSYPISTITKLVKLLKPGGYLLVTTPNVFRWQNLIKMIFRKNIYFPLFQLKQSINFRHQREYALEELAFIFANQGLKIHSQAYFIGYPPNRKKNKTDKLTIKLIKYFNYFFSICFPARRDSLYLLCRK